MVANVTDHYQFAPVLLKRAEIRSGMSAVELDMGRYVNLTLPEDVFA
jgi:hypothetical protein